MKIAYFNYIEPIELKYRDALEGSHTGDCTKDIQYLMTVDYIKKQLDKIQEKQLIIELEEYGAWDMDELLDHSQNLEHILWIACGHIREDLRG